MRFVGGEDMVFSAVDAVPDLPPFLASADHFLNALAFLLNLGILPFSLVCALAQVIWTLEQEDTRA